jgi:transcriptional regulator with XRE-family HTH domain
MQRAGIGQVELGRKTGLTQSKISRYLRGASEPRLSDVTRLAEFFQVRAEEIIGDGNGALVLEAHDHIKPAIEYEAMTTAEEALDKILRRNKTLYEALRQQIVAVERWDAQKRKRKKMK